MADLGYKGKVRLRYGQSALLFKEFMYVLLILPCVCGLKELLPRVMLLPTELKGFLQ